MCGNACYWRDEARFLRVELDNESREREETETYVAMLESQKAESDLCLEDVANQLANAHEEIEKLRLELETTYEGYVALDDLYMQRIAEDEAEDGMDVDEFIDHLDRLTDEAEAERVLSEARYLELADNAEAEACGLPEFVELPPLPDIHTDATDGDQEVFYSGKWFVFSEYERDRLERALAEKLADVAELTAIRNKMTGK